jgi:hypothetical protein
VTNALAYSAVASVTRKKSFVLHATELKLEQDTDNSTVQAVQAVQAVQDVQDVQNVQPVQVVQDVQGDQGPIL